MPLVPVKPPDFAAPVHAAVDALVEKMRAEGEQHSFRLDALLKENAELKSELARLQAEIETRAAAPDAPAKRAPRKPKAPKPVEAAVLPDPDAP